MVEHVEKRLAAPRAPGIEGRVPGRELRPGMERELALSFLSQLGGASGVHSVGMDSHGLMAGSRAGGMGSLGTPGRAAGTPMAAAGGPMMGVVSGLGATAGVLCQNSAQPASTKELRLSKSGELLAHERVTRGGRLPRHCNPAGLRDGGLPGLRRGGRPPNALDRPAGRTAA